MRTNRGQAGRAGGGLVVEHLGHLDFTEAPARLPGTTGATCHDHWCSDGIPD